MKIQEVTKYKMYFYLFLFRILVCSGKYCQVEDVPSVPDFQSIPGVPSVPCFSNDPLIQDIWSESDRASEFV